MNIVSVTLTISVRSVDGRVVRSAGLFAQIVRMNLKYASIDVETTGLNSKVHSVIEVAVIIADTKDSETPITNLPCYRSTIFQENITWSKFCIGLHNANGLIKELYDNPDRTTENVYKELDAFLHQYLGKPDWNAAGKNVGSFDIPFLKQLGPFRFRHRVLDPAILFHDRRDDRLPDLATCLKRAGLNPEVEHRAYSDAAAVIQLLRKVL